MEHYRDELLSQFLDQELPEPKMRQVARHLADCPECREVLAQLRLIVTAAENADRLEPSPRVWAAIQERVRSVSMPVWRRPGRWAWLAAPALVAAAVIAIVLLGRQPAPVAPAPVPVAVQPAVVTTPPVAEPVVRLRPVPKAGPRPTSVSRVEPQPLAASRQSGQDVIAAGYEQFREAVNRALAESEQARRENPGNHRVRTVYAGFHSAEMTVIDRLVAGGE